MLSDTNVTFNHWMKSSHSPIKNQLILENQLEKKPHQLCVSLGQYY